MTSITCPAIDSNWAKLGLGVLLSLGLVISYLPQIIKLYRKKSSDGISPYFLFLAAIGCFSTTANVLLLQFADVKCCFVAWETVYCVQNLMGILQVIVQWGCLMVIFAMYYIYFPPSRTTITVGYDTTNNSPKKIISHEWKVSLTIGTLVSLYDIIVFVIGCVLLFAPIEFSNDDNNNSDKDTNSESGRIHHVRLFGNTLGLLSLICSTTQFLPQIIRTYSDKTIGALSIPTMLIQTPGAFIFAYSLMIQPGTDWTSWISYCVSGALQGVLLAVCVAWWVRERAMEKEEAGRRLLVGDESEEESEDDGDLDAEKEDFEAREEDVEKEEEVVVNVDVDADTGDHEKNDSHQTDPQQTNRGNAGSNESMVTAVSSGLGDA